MLSFDLRKLSPDALQEAIEAYCAAFGAVQAVKVVPAVGNDGTAKAAVLMSSAEEAAQLRMHAGDSINGRIVFIMLRHEERPN